MMDNFNQINTLSLDREALFEVALDAEKTRDFSKSINGDVTVGLSSGTSGRRGLFLASRAERAQWAGYIIGRLLPSLVAPERIALLLRANSNLYTTVARAHLRFHYVDLSQPVDQWMCELEAFNPSIMVGSAQALLLASQSTKTLWPKLVISGAEVLTPEDKTELVNRFSCEVKEVYQCTEGFLACTHQDGELRWNEDLVFVEHQWLNPQKTHFQPIITDFRRRSQPIIRYLMDDVIVSAEQNGVFQSIKGIAGRCGDMLSIGGVHVLPDLVYNAVSRAVAHTVNYKISQIEANRIKINTDHSAEAIENALRELLSRLGVAADFTLQFDHASGPDWELTNKRRRVVNLCTV